MQNEQTNKTDTGRNEANKVVEKPLSIVDEAKKVRDEIKAENDRREEILKEEQKIASNNLLGGTSGGHVETQINEEEVKKNKAMQFWKGTGIDKAIEKHG